MQRVSFLQAINNKRVNNVHKSNKTIDETTSTSQKNQSTWVSWITCSCYLTSALNWNKTKTKVVSVQSMPREWVIGPGVNSGVCCCCWMTLWAQNKSYRAERWAQVRQKINCLERRSVWLVKSNIIKKKLLCDIYCDMNTITPDELICLFGKTL